MQCNNCGSELSVASKFCPSCGSPAGVVAETTAVLPKEKSSPRRVAIFLFPVVLIAGIGLFIKFINPSVNHVIGDQPVVAPQSEYDSNFVEMKNIGFKEDGGDLVFSLDEVKQSRLIRFQYTGGQTPRAVMAYIAPTGQLVTAISVSEHCGSTEFKIKDNKIFCAHCPSNWDMMTMEAYACCAKYFPDPIPSRVVGDEVHVSKTVVEKWAGRL